MNRRLRRRAAVLVLAALAAAVVLAGIAAAAAKAPPTVRSLPRIVGTPVVGTTVTARPGQWAGTRPLTYAYQWRRCTRQNCRDIPGATQNTYTLSDADAQRWLRVRVTVSNREGSASAVSNLFGPVRRGAAPPPQTGPAGQIRLPDGKISIPITSVTSPERLIVSEVRFSPNPVRSRTAPITVRFRVTDTRGFVVRGALVFVRSTPLVTSTPPEQATLTNGYVTFVLVPRADFRLGKAVQFFVRARREGENLLAGSSGRRLVQVRTVG